MQAAPPAVGSATPCPATPPCSSRASKIERVCERAKESEVMSMIDQTMNRERTAMVPLAVGTIAVCLVGLGANVHAQRFHVEEVERRVQYDWISNSLQEFGSDSVVSYATEGLFAESIADSGLSSDYELRIDARQTSDLGADRFTASGASSFFFEAGEFAQGAHADLNASSTFFFFFQVDKAGPYDLTGLLEVEAPWNVQVSIVNDTTGEELFVRASGGPLNERVVFDTTSFYTFEVTSFGSFFIDDRNAFEVQFDGRSSFNVNFEPAPDLTIEGACPGPITLTATGMTPGAGVAFVYAFRPGSFVIPNGPCAGVELGLSGNGLQVGSIVPADANGVARLIRTVPGAACDRVFVQAVDTADCATTDVEGL